MSESPPATRKVRHSLGRSLLVWFLLLALLPLSLTAWLGYRQSVEGLTAAAIEKLEQGAQSKSQLIHTWFGYRFMDLNSQAENRRNAGFLQALSEGLESSGLSPRAFVASDTWAMLVADRQHDLATFARNYDYFYDLFLIDKHGNILFTVAREFDLGSNLFDGPYAATSFARIAKTSLKNGQMLFSDFEGDGPSRSLLTGFLSAPILDEQGNMLGLFAIQLRLDRLSELMLEQRGDDSLIHYLVGDDGRLRTPLDRFKSANAMDQPIDTEQIRLWQHEHGKFGEGADDEFELAFEYTGPLGQQVIGLHQTVRLPGANWALISEIDRDKALAAAHRLGEMILTLFFLTALLVALLAMYQARRITRPIIQLVDASKAVAAGNLDQQVSVKANNEIGVLATAFNDMLSARRQHMEVLEESNDIAQMALAELAEQKFALDQHAIVAITDAQGNITFSNEKFSKITGYSRAELSGQNHRILNSGYHDETFFRDMYGTIGRGDVWHGEICNKAKDGHLYWVDTTIVPFMDENNKPQSYIAIRTDISQRKQTEFELLKAKEAAEAATRQKSDFLANMSHEIRTPMNGIIGMTGLLLDSGLTAKQHSYAEATMNSADALLTIINDILDFSKIEAGKLALETVSFDLQCLAEEVAELMALKCCEKGVDMLLRYKPGTERLVAGDPGRVRQILLNLLSNAIKFTEQGYILLTVESIETTDKTASFRVAVEDSGIGIAGDKLEHIFNKFDQEDSSTTRKYGGTGLGLAICKQLCTMMHGDIDVKSQKGKGSTFSFTMTLGVRHDASPAYTHLDGHEQIKGLKTLIVDDGEMSRTIMNEQLQALQMRLTSVGAAGAAFEAAQQARAQNEPFDIVIVGCHMPKTDTKALAAFVSQLDLPARSALLYVASCPCKGDGSRIKALGFDAYLTRPTHPSEVPKILSLLWAAKQQGRDIPLVTRHTLHEAEAGGRQKSVFADTHILLVEDNPINVTVATELLEGHGCTVTPAGNGLEALALVKTRGFDFIFMDCQMPEMDGYEATAAIRKLQSGDAAKRIPIVAFTANAMASDQQKCLNAGMDDFITKPVSQQALEKMLVKWLSHKIKGSVKVEAQPYPSGKANATPPAVASADVLDLAVFNRLKQLLGDKFVSLIEQHSQNALENVHRVAEAIAQGDADALERAAHSLKGASAQFGALRLNRLAFDMEALAERGELDKAGAMLAALQEARQQAAQAMSQYSRV